MQTNTILHMYGSKHVFDLEHNAATAIAYMHTQHMQLAKAKHTSLLNAIQHADCHEPCNSIGMHVASSRLQRSVALVCFFIIFLNVLMFLLYSCSTINLNFVSVVLKVCILTPIPSQDKGGLW